MTGNQAFARRVAGPRSDGRFQVLADEDLSAALARFYLGLPFDDRRQRFGAGVSHASIQRYCAAIDTKTCFGVALIAQANLCALLEVHALGGTFETAELTASFKQPRGRLHIVAHLVQIAAFEAARRGCGRLVVDADGCTAALLEVLSDVGIRGSDGLTGFDIGDYAVDPTVEAPVASASSARRSRAAEHGSPPPSAEQPARHGEAVAPAP